MSRKPRMSRPMSAGQSSTVSVTQAVINKSLRRRACSQLGGAEASMARRSDANKARGKVKLRARGGLPRAFRCAPACPPAAPRRAPRRSGNSAGSCAHEGYPGTETDGEPPASARIDLAIEQPGERRARRQLQLFSHALEQPIAPRRQPEQQPRQLERKLPRAGGETEHLVRTGLLGRAPERAEVEACLGDRGADQPVDLDARPFLAVELDAQVHRSVKLARERAEFDRRPERAREQAGAGERA